MNQPLIYKYRPNCFKDFEIDKKLINLLIELINMDNLNIILLGDSGCGKTSLINCIIKEYYKDNYNISNVLIINSLKDQGISYYRHEVKTFCQTICTMPKKKKFVVLDDIDNINEQSQQVFRNCMDKYSNNVHFIASCSNIQKVIDSIQSRVIIIKIKSLEKYNLEKIMMKICDKENITITEDAKDFILSISNNSIRTIINYLEKFKLISNNINYDIAISVCTNISFKDFMDYTNLCREKKIVDAIQRMYYIYDRGYSVIDILDNYFLFLKSTSLMGEVEKYEAIKLLCHYILIFYNIHEDEIELALFTNNLISILS
jgi:DNA polymerase III delta prime subunit